MIIYFDRNGVLKEIITERVFRVGDYKRDKIYVYWDGDHSAITGWVKFRLPNGNDTVEYIFYGPSNPMVAIQLPTEPKRNFRYFSYDHTYNDNGTQRIGYLVYEITVPPAALNSSLDNSLIYPDENNMVLARARFIMNQDQEVETLGAIPFAVETNMGIITDESINISQYNYLLDMASRELDETTPEQIEEILAS